MYQDRFEAGMALSEKLMQYKNANGIVLAVPRGGVPVAYVVAKELGLPMDVIYSKKIGHPKNKEYAIGASGIDESFVVPHEDVSESYIVQEKARIRAKLLEMKKMYTGDKEPLPIAGKIAIVIDDGVATGNTLLATINILKKSKPQKIVLAVPVASRTALERLSKVADEVVCPLVPNIFWGVGEFYKEFEQVSDEEVIEFLRLLSKAKADQHG